MRLEVSDTLAEADRAPLLDLWVDAWAAAMPDIDFEARRAWLSAHLDSLLAAGAILILAREAGGPAGFCTLDRASGELDQLAVGRPFQRRGVARALLAEARRLCPAGLRLTVNTANARALAFYERAGFQRIGDAVNPRSGLPVRIMRWTPGPGINDVK